MAKAFRCAAETPKVQGFLSDLTPVTCMSGVVFYQTGVAIGGFGLAGVPRFIAGKTVKNAPRLSRVTE